eukprot:2395557-Amphidinium_carterae.1
MVLEYANSLLAILRREGQIDDALPNATVLVLWLPVNSTFVKRGFCQNVLLCAPLVWIQMEKY